MKLRNAGLIITLLNVSALFGETPPDVRTLQPDSLKKGIQLNDLGPAKSVGMKVPPRPMPSGGTFPELQTLLLRAKVDPLVLVLPADGKLPAELRIDVLDGTKELQVIRLKLDGSSLKGGKGGQAIVFPIDGKTLADLEEHSSGKNPKTIRVYAPGAQTAKGSAPLLLPSSRLTIH